jgi:hypothetical protein
MSEEFEEYMKEFNTPTEAQTYVDKELKDWPCDENNGGLAPQKVGVNLSSLYST